MSDIRQAIKLIGGVEPTPQQMQRVQAIAHSLGIPNNDAMMPILIALDCYHGAFNELPAKAQAAADASAKVAADRSAAAVNESVARAVTQLGPKVGDAIVRVANDIKQVDKIKWIGGAISSVAMVVGVFGWITHESGYSSGFEMGKAQAYQDAKDEKAAAAWANTAQGKMAYQLAQTGSLDELANCTGEGWRIFKNDEGNWMCYPFMFPKTVDGKTGEYAHGWSVAKSARGAPARKKSN